MELCRKIYNKVGIKMYGNKFVIVAEKGDKKLNITFYSLYRAQKNFDRLINRENYEKVELYLVNDFYKRIGEYKIERKKENV